MHLTKIDSLIRSVRKTAKYKGHSGVEAANFKYNLIGQGFFWCVDFRAIDQEPGSHLKRQGQSQEGKAKGGELYPKTQESELN